MYGQCTCRSDGQPHHRFALTFVLTTMQVRSVSYGSSAICLRKNPTQILQTTDFKKTA
jgi:hypothetical protein